MTNDNDNQLNASTATIDPIEEIRQATEREPALLSRLLRIVRIPAGRSVTNADRAMEHLSFICGEPEEHVAVVALNARHKAIDSTVISHGGPKNAIVSPRAIFRWALQHEASAVIIAHNHPSGDPTPSAQDVEVTRRMMRAARTLGVRFLDHLVIGSGGYISLASLGYCTDSINDGPVMAYEPTVDAYRA